MNWIWPDIGKDRRADRAAAKEAAESYGAMWAKENEEAVAGG